MKQKLFLIVAAFAALVFTACENDTGEYVNNPQPKSVKPVDTSEVESDEIIFQFRTRDDYGNLQVMDPEFCANERWVGNHHLLKGYKGASLCQGGVDFLSGYTDFSIGKHRLYNRVCDTGMIQACYFKPIYGQDGIAYDFKQYDCIYGGGTLEITKIENGRYSGTFSMTVARGNDTIKIRDGVFKNVPFKEGK